MTRSSAGRTCFRRVCVGSVDGTRGPARMGRILEGFAAEDSRSRSGDTLEREPLALVPCGGATEG